MKVIRFVLKNNFMVLFFMLCFMLLSQAAVFPNGQIMRFFFPLSLILVSMGAIISISPDRRRKVYAYILGGGGIVFQVLGYFVEAVWYQDIYLLYTITFYTYIQWRVLRFLLSTPEVNQNTFYAAFSGYMLIGINCALIMIAIMITIPNAYNNMEATDWKNAFYYSFMTLTTVGYGDITPEHPVAKVLSMFLGMAGQFYLTVVMALLISKYTNSKA
ncbi:potassium channel family protein [Persicobacter sp. CCB-QB2]|uniref:potassium channel family protein n=1 Tax=Persicobacter sp. CCB-QB2 TaxID=1561025 RepID=UPI0006A949C6|nr:potassium channel family protein [Persicobacter sp. CCB-QB2]